METTEIPAGSIVVGIDGSPWSDGALDWAIDQAIAEHRALTVVHALEPTGAQPFGMYASDSIGFGRLMEDTRNDAQSLLHAAVAHAHERAPDLEVRQVLSFADPRSSLLEIADRAAMIVIGSRGRGPVSSLLLGSVSVAVAKHAVCPVVVRRRVDLPGADRGILLGVDGSDTSTAAIEFAFRMASVRERPLTVLHAYWAAVTVATARSGAPAADLEDEYALVSESIAGMNEKFPDVVVEVTLVRGFADQQLIVASPDYELLVVGHHRIKSLADLIYGSVAPTVLEHARGAVAVVPTPPGGMLVP